LVVIVANLRSRSPGDRAAGCRWRPYDLASDQAGDGQNHGVQPLGRIGLVTGILSVRRAIVIRRSLFPALIPVINSH
jgi:hypothetical protein